LVGGNAHVATVSVRSKFPHRIRYSTLPPDQHHVSDVAMHVEVRGNP